LDFLYELGATLHRRFTHDQVRKFVSEYIAALIYFYKVEGLEKDLVFYDMVKPQPEVDPGKGHKDGIHIQGIGISTAPKLQFGIRGYLLQRDVTTRLFPPHNKSAEKCYDVAVIKNNNWFLYGSSKPNKAQLTCKPTLALALVWTSPEWRLLAAWDKNTKVVISTVDVSLLDQPLNT
jgi:hypothetical protein